MRAFQFLLPAFALLLLLAMASSAAAQSGGGSQPPVADANGPYAGVAGSPVTLDGSGSSDPDGTIIVYEWNIDNDGTFDDVTGMNPSNTWNNPGTYVVGLRVTDNDGLTGTAYAEVVITAPSQVEVPEFELPAAVLMSIAVMMYLMLGRKFHLPTAIIKAK